MINLITGTTHCEHGVFFEHCLSALKFEHCVDRFN